ncbi:MAG: glucose-1-phosphate adenylyltransferase [Chloroflexi bacterium GWB2_49_20]|nr:MAG: glucose-1-phosphate adenylyltransferase [Chloroflexi bacterium GWB2_49_20]OGN78985.1 MAG: glucose-1-phosphate adenylyltransferase [Chloroflexi bacterium GWC2_49_37]OGN86254.1 MAG: glucose-1-phosphate adenylyltransferase [Chloroflexi bacterium GWD2_49_16]
MRTRAVIMAGGEGSRLSVLTAKRTKPAVPFAGKYRIIDFALSNCVNSNIYDVMVLMQYRPHSLIEHIGAGGPWDLNRDFSGGIRMYTPFKARYGSDWYLGTADAVQQNFAFIKQTKPDYILILSGDHIYAMDYDPLITFHRDHEADLTMATIHVPPHDASRYGIVGVDDDYKVTSFVEKPKNPPTDLANMGVYLFNMDTLDQYLWEDHKNKKSSHDFGKDLLPRLVADGKRVYAYPYSGYWVDVGTIQSYWQAHMDLLANEPPLKLNDRSWVIHTRTEERPPVRIAAGAVVMDSMLSDGCVIESGAKVENSVFSPGVIVRSGAIVRQSILLTDVIVDPGAVVERAILDKRVQVGEKASVGSLADERIVLAGKNSQIPAGAIIQPGATIANDVVVTDYANLTIGSMEIIETKRKPNEI